MIERMLAEAEGYADIQEILSVLIKEMDKI
jgi:hypothetical protein